MAKRYHFQENRHESFMNALGANMAAASVPDYEIALTNGGASAAVRARGAFLTDLVLKDGASDRLVQVTYAETDRTKAKMVATHAMMPVGPYAGAGGQHGIQRWLDYRLTALEADSMALAANTRGLPLSITEELDLHLSFAQMATSVINRLQTDVSTSLGWHLYLALPSAESLEDVTLGVGFTPGAAGLSFDDVFGKGALGDIMSGKARFWAGFGENGGRIEMQHPDGHRVSVIASESHPEGTPYPRLGLLGWQRPGEPFVCLEPTLGFAALGDETFNDGVLIPPCGQAALRTTVTAY